MEKLYYNFYWRRFSSPHMNLPLSSPSRLAGSFPRRREATLQSKPQCINWIPVCTGMTKQGFGMIWRCICIKSNKFYNQTILIEETEITMVYKFTGVDEAGARALLAKALPILRKHGAPTDVVNTCEISNAIVAGPNGEPIEGFGNITFYFPNFDALRNSGHIDSIADELAKALGCPCYTIYGDVIVGFP